MNKGQRVLTTSLWGLLVLLMVGLLASWASLGRQDERHHERAPGHPAPVVPEAMVAEFRLTDQAGKTFANRDLPGRMWLVDFIFTTCPGPCPLMTRKMADLQKRIDDPRVGFLSFSVDPITDTPAVLKEYGEKNGADPTRWHFLTGPDATIQSIARSLLLGTSPAAADQPIVHSTRFLLLDGSGHVRGYYDSLDSAALDKLVADATALAEHLPGKPSLP